MGKQILAVYPHPDDETFDRAGTLIKHKAKGDELTLICATLGQMGRRMGKPFFANRETLPNLREQELRDACAILGIEDIRLWRLQDKMLQFMDLNDLAARILDVIIEKEITVIYTFYPGHGVHPDHDTMSAATVLAVSQLPIDQQPVIYGSPFSCDHAEQLGEPDLVHDISDVLDVKMEAMKAHRSQTEIIISELNKKISENPSRVKQIMKAFTIEKYWIYQIPNALHEVERKFA